MGAVEVHTHPTRDVPPLELDSTMVLVGECGGLSAVIGDVRTEAAKKYGFVRVETEHGLLYLDPDKPAPVLDMA